MHPSQLKTYKSLTAGMQSSSKRKRGPDQPCETDSHRPLKRQLKIGEESPEMALVSAKTLSQADIDRMILDFAIDGLLPFRFVSLPSFNRIIKSISPRFNVISESTLKRRYCELAMTISQNVKSVLNDVNYVATTTDGWSIRGRAFLGVTAHWIDPNSIERSWAALSCERLQGSHTYDVLAGAVSSIHIRFGIAQKVVSTTTDNASNFVKAFRVFGDVDDGLDEEEEEDTADEDLVHPVSISETLENQQSNSRGTSVIQLPPHKRCACHTMNLIATKDAQDAESDPQFKKLYRSSTAKATAIWNKSSRSVQTAESIMDICKQALVKPNQTRWNSWYMAIQRLAKINKEDPRALALLCERIKLPR